MADNLLDKASILLTPTAYNDGSMLSVKPESGDGDFTFSRGSAATRVNAQGLVENVQIISPELVSNGDFSQEGSELVTNGDFATDSDWTLDTGWSIGDGYAESTALSTRSIYQNIGNAVVGKIYKVTYTILETNGGNFRAVYGGVNGTMRNTEGTYVEYFNATSSADDNLYLDSLNVFIGKIDNISVKEVGQDWTIENTWTIGDGVANGNGANGNSEELIQSLNFDSSKKYKISYEISNYVSGSVRYSLAGSGGYNGQNKSTNGTYVDFINTGASHNQLKFFGLNFNGSVSNISVKEITDDTDLPRIDYTDGCGSWLLEGQSTNLITESESFSSWNKDASVSITSTDKSSPLGTNNASEITVTDSGRLYHDPTISTTADRVTSIFIKAGTFVNFKFTCIVSSEIDLNAETATNNFGIQKLTNGWFRISTTAQSVTSTSRRIQLQAYPDNTYTNGHGQTGTYSIIGTQMENTLLTSYIPTNGATNTRLQDIANNSGNATLINSTEGVLYAEIAALADDLSQRQISIDDGTGNNRIVLRYNNVSNNINAYLFNGTVQGGEFNYVVSDITEFSKIAFKYKQNDFALWVDGIERATDTSGNTFSADTLKDLSFDFNGSFDFYGKVKALAVFKEALTDAELQSLTTI